MKSGTHVPYELSNSRPIWTEPVQKVSLSRDESLSKRVTLWIWHLKLESSVSKQGGKDPQDALSLQVVFRKRALELVALLRKITCNFRHPMGLRHPVRWVSVEMVSVETNFFFSRDVCLSKWVTLLKMTSDTRVRTPADSRPREKTSLLRKTSLFWNELLF